MKLLSVAVVVALIIGSAAQENKRPAPPGLPCHHAKYQCWTEWFDSDNPRNGDREILRRLRRRYRGKICPRPIDIEARTLSGLTPEQAGDVIAKSDTKTGFICRKRDQPDRECEDYKVRFSCPPPYCADPVCWTQWYDRDNPSGTGDWETLSALRRRYGDEICKEPLYIEAVTTDELTPAANTRQNFHIYNPTTGFVCRNKDQKVGNCMDYKVRFGCPCNH
ncbi:cartilage intermediate layer protein 2-like [Kryptolebias marmoratus]|uniref:Cartilage intermediate layer protein 2-like n=1 Tax=Kryptolebias marmoratus TaxID=37003 RepID=A0A3Q3AZV1_KRYMA|nr:cartilage intermediate layer protein 2-like [Kryptolebias marmoratus]